MKRIIVILAVFVLGYTSVYAQKVVNTTDVPERYITNFKNATKDETVNNLTWMQVDTLVFDAVYTNDNGTRMSQRFTPKGTETRWYIDSKYYPKAIKDTVAYHYPKFKIKELYVLKVRNKATYQAQIVKTGGFLFFKREKSIKYLNFETDGKFIDEIDVK